MDKQCQHNDLIVPKINMVIQITKDHSKIPLKLQSETAKTAKTSDIVKVSLKLLKKTAIVIEDLFSLSKLKEAQPDSCKQSYVERGLSSVTIVYYL